MAMRTTHQRAEILPVQSRENSHGAERTDMLNALRRGGSQRSRSTVTLSLFPDTIPKAKILAAQRKTSRSRLFVDCLEDLEMRDRASQSAGRRALTHRKRGFD
jgi:hypothetical protein